MGVGNEENESCQGSCSWELNLMIVVSHIPVRIITADHNLQLIGLFKVFSFRNYYFFQKPHKEVQKG